MLEFFLMSLEHVPRNLPRQDLKVDEDLDGRVITGEAAPRIIPPDGDESTPVNFVIVDRDPEIERKIKNKELVLLHESGRLTVHWKLIVAAAAVATVGAAGLGIREIIRHRHQKPD